MGVIHLPARHRSHRWLIACLVGVVLISAWLGRALLYESWTLASLPAFWWSGSDRFLLSAPGSDFDISFANYSIIQTSAAPFEDRVPPILHHVAMGGAGAAARIEQWKEVRQSCLDIHPGWEAHIWTDEKANAFVAEQFPELREMWKGYQFPIQRIDALRYMVLYHYGGVILDMDLQCRRALGPLRRFDFVAPAAHPTGFSVGFMMASQRNPFVGALVRNLRPYNRAWLGLPYPTVMFSTGCHYASTIHAYQPNRTTLKVLAGPSDNFRLHSLNGQVQTPIFNHLGSSSWHSYDAALIVSVGRMFAHKLPILAVVGGVVVFVVVRRTKRRRGVRV